MTTQSFSFPPPPDDLYSAPSGWYKELTSDGNVLFINELTGRKWHMLLDDQSGKYYYYNETTNETSWKLPQMLPQEESGAELIQCNESELHHTEKEWEKIIEKQGWLNWMKLVETGKKQKKYWTQQWTVLLANNMLFFKDQKQAAATKKLPYGKPDSNCDLRGAKVDWTDYKSSKKKMIKLRTAPGLYLLLQHENPSEIQEWFSAMKETIQKADHVNSIASDISSLKTKHNHNEDELFSTKKKDKKIQIKPARHGSDAKSSDVRSKLKKFMLRRPTIESLQEKGIIKETVFGSSLDHLCSKDHSSVPNFVKLCVEEVEKRGLDIDGIYRVSGNVSHVQKLRYFIDRDQVVNLSDSQWEDIHLITSALKMFLRELPEPVFPFQFFNEFINACKILDDDKKVAKMRYLVQTMPRTNKDTLKYLMQHFSRVVEHSSNNRMEVQNIAIVFGPTLLLKPPDKSRLDICSDGQMTVFMVYQNQIIDIMLTKYHDVFEN